MLIFKMVLRNVLRQKRRSFLTCLMMTAGFVLLSISIGISDGSYSNIIELVTRDHTGHIQIHKRGYLDCPSLYNTLDSGDGLDKKLESFPDVQASAPRLYCAVLAFAGKKTMGVRVTGIDPDREAQTTRLRLKVTKGKYISRSPGKDVMLSDALAKALDVGVGGEIVLIGQGADGSIANDLFEVGGIVDVEGTGYGDMNCYMHIKTAQDFHCLYDRFHEIAIILDDQARSQQVANRIEHELDNSTLDVEPWQVVEREFYQAMQTDVKGMNLVFVILMVVVGTGILDTVLMTILERTPEFGLMRAMGTRPVDVFKLIVYETACLSVIGILLGGIIAFVCNYIIMHHGIPLPDPIHFGGVYLDRIIGEVSVRVFLRPAVITFATAMLVSIYPAYRAASVSPIYAIKSN